jgi:hypothetical protein
MEVGLAKERYFRCGNVAELRGGIEKLLAHGLSEAARDIIREQIKERYNWDKIAEETLRVYEKALTKRLRLWGSIKSPSKHLRNGNRSSPLRLRG